MNAQIASNGDVSLMPVKSAEDSIANPRLAITDGLRCKSFCPLTMPSATLAYMITVAKRLNVMIKFDHENLTTCSAFTESTDTTFGLGPGGGDDVRIRVEVGGLVGEYGARILLEIKLIRIILFNTRLWWQMVPS